MTKKYNTMLNQFCFLYVDPARFTVLTLKNYLYSCKHSPQLLSFFLLRTDACVIV